MTYRNNSHNVPAVKTKLLWKLDSNFLEAFFFGYAIILGSSLLLNWGGWLTETYYVSWNHYWGAVIALIGIAIFAIGVTVLIGAFRRSFVKVNQ